MPGVSWVVLAEWGVGNTAQIRVVLCRGLFQQNRQTGLGPFQEELFIGSKVFGIRLCSFEQLEKDKASPNKYSEGLLRSWFATVNRLLVPSVSCAYLLERAKEPRIMNFHTP